MQILVRIGPTVWPATPLQTDRQTFAYIYIDVITQNFVHLLSIPAGNVPIQL